MENDIGLTLMFHDEVEMCHWVKEESSIHPLMKVRKEEARDKPQKRYVLTAGENEVVGDNKVITHVEQE